MDRQAPSESAFESIGHAFGSTGVEREHISTLRKCIWIDGRRARAYFSISKPMGGPSEAHRKPIGGSPISVEKTSTFCVSLTPEGLVFDDPMEPLRHARIGFCSTKTILLAREQFMENVWHCTRNGFGARKLPAERSPRPKVLHLSSGMHQSAQTTVFVVPENEKALELRVSSSQNSHRSNVGFQ